MPPVPDTTLGVTASPDPLLGQVLGQGRYRIDALLGSGGMGRVYRATHLGLGHAVAVKVVSTEHAADATIERFLREARMAASIAHPNVISVFDVGRTDTHAWYAMECVEGRSLDFRLAIEPPLTSAEALTIVTQVASGLAASHQRQILHRDLKPGNILLQALDDGRLLATVSDFGIARPLGAATDGLTVPGQFVGTAEYSSPEQMAMVASITSASDTYSLALVSARILAGRLPSVPARFAPTPQAIQREIGVPEAIARVLHTALAYLPEDRHASPLDFAAQLAHAVHATGYHVQHRSQETAPESPLPTELLPGSATTRRPLPRRAAVMAIAALATAAAAGVWITNGPATSPAVARSVTPHSGRDTTPTVPPKISTPAPMVTRATDAPDGTRTGKPITASAPTRLTLGARNALDPVRTRNDTINDAGATSVGQTDSAGARNGPAARSSGALATFRRLVAADSLTDDRAHAALQLGARLLPGLETIEERANVRYGMATAYAFIGDVPAACEQLHTRDALDTRTRTARVAAWLRTRLDCDG